LKRLVLVGGGHAHVRVLADWRAAPLPGVSLTVVSPSALAPYSGMVPGWMAGLYDFASISIDVAKLSKAAGATFIEAEVQALHARTSTLRVAGHGDLPYDLLSLNIGSTLRAPTLPVHAVLSMRPLGDLRLRWAALIDGIARDSTTPRRIVAAGGGPAGVEALLAALARLRAHAPKARFDGVLLTNIDRILPQHGAWARRRVERALERAGVTIHTHIDAGGFDYRGDDIVLWATGAQAHDWPRASGLAIDERGFVTVDAAMRSTSHPSVFACGDCAAWVQPLPKAGVTAVRQGPVLSRNLRAALSGSAVEPFVPRRRQLALLATADSQAIASWGAWSARGAWVWRWKDRIDRAFIARFDVPATRETNP
jgi:pyridine nucleotide-disulfide oxidoreductase family protein